MPRYFYQDMVVPDFAAREYRIFDRRRGAAEDEYALAVCTDHEVAQKIIDLLNAASEAQERGASLLRLLANPQEETSNYGY